MPRENPGVTPVIQPAAPSAMGERIPQPLRIRSAPGARRWIAPCWMCGRRVGAPNVQVLNHGAEAVTVDITFYNYDGSPSQHGPYHVTIEPRQVFRTGYLNDTLAQDATGFFTIVASGPVLPFSWHISIHEPPSLLPLALFPQDE